MTTPPNPPRLTVIAPVYRDIDGLKKLLGALAGQVDAGEHEIIIADNEGSPQVEALVRGLPSVRYVQELRKGSYAARNAAIRVATGTIFAFTDSDCIPAANWLQMVRGHFGRQPELQLAGGRIIVEPADAQNPNAWECVDLVSAFRQEDLIKRGGVAVTANLLVRKEAFDVCGLFDATLQSGGDTAWCRAAGKHGCKIEYLPEAVVSHPARASRAEHLRKRQRVVSGLYRRTQIHPDQYRLWPHLRGALRPPLGAMYRAAKSPRIPKRKVPAALLALLTIYGYDLFCWLRCLWSPSGSGGKP